MAYKKWIVSECDKSAVSELAQTCDTDPFLTLIAVARGYTTPDELEMFFSDEPILASPYELPGVYEAAEHINKAIENGKKIAVFGDYDCDGITATALFYSYLRKRGADCTYYLPDRFNDGYGMNNNAIDHLKSEGVELIITVDNGIAAVEEVEYAKQIGIETVVTDHHLPPERLPEALAIVDPHLPECNCEFKDVSGVMVAFKVVCAVDGAEPEELLPEYADLLAIGLVADIMPLKDENRCVVREGIKAINNTKKMGITALLNAAAIGRGSVNAGKIAFGIAPRINAVGRISSPIPAMELLLCEDFKKANELAALMEEQNHLRHSEETAVFNAAVQAIEKNGFQHHRIVMVAGEGWHHGVLGIAAAKITEKYGKPAILLSVENEVAMGSGRSIEGFSLHDALCSAEDILVKFGGHKAAAGLTVEADKIEELRNRLNAFAEKSEPCVPVLKLDCRLNLAGINLNLAEAITELEPCGMGNPTPIFGLYNCQIVKINELSSGKHTRLFVSRDGHTAQIMVFNVPTNTFPFIVGDVIDIAVTVGVNEYNGNRSVSIVAKALKKSGVKEDSVFEELALYDDFKCGIVREYSVPTREEIGAVYKQIGTSAFEETVRQRFIGTLGIFKTLIAIDVLEELNLISRRQENNFTLLMVNSGQKADLATSEILKKLRG